MVEIRTPIKSEVVADLRVGDKISIFGKIYTGRDMALPKLVRLLGDGSAEAMGIELDGSVIFHTAVSPAGVGPTSSNKAEIEGSMPALSAAGVRLHLGKGSLRQDTVEALAKHGSIYVVIPPVTALLEGKTLSRRVVLFGEDGMEAMYELEVAGYPAIVAAAHGESIYR
ncbi:MAG: fumarate hydratase C-terminal domain-containing protein [Clostridiales bacterium]|nr:fumarate hydratase C-terminal domain-containing protein [Clostridiales bacterium]